MSDVQLGWAGLGNMGTPIIKNLLKAGFKVAVYNRTKEKEKELIEAGATSAENPNQLIEKCDVVFTMVSDDEAVKQIYTGENGLLNNQNTGKLAIDMSTVSPATSRYLAEACHNKGMEFLDAPVSGSVKPAQDGTLIIMAGGAEQAFNRAKPIFDKIGKLSVYLGDNGAGSSAKLAINYLLGLNLQGLAETVLFAKKNGIKTEDMLTIINEGACGNGITRLKSTNIINNDFQAAFALKLIAKDLRLAGEQGLKTPLFAPLLNSYTQALQKGLGEEDAAAIYKYLQDND